MNRTVVFLFSVAALFVTLTTRAQTTSGPNPEDSTKPAEQVFKNIQVLKGQPAYQVVQSMQFISNSLGVECEFCHEQHAFDKDDKKTKQTARQMIQMQMAINRDNFKGQNEVTCFSCHRGSHDPVGVPIIADEEAKRPEAEKAQAAPPAMPSADEILNKYVQAIGGADALKKVTSRQEKGTINFGGRQMPVEVLAKAPDKRISIVHTPNGENITAFDGHAGWVANPGPRPPREMSLPETEATSFDAAFYLPTEISKMFSQLRVRPSEKIAGHDAVQLIGFKEGKPPVRFFFDKDTGLLLRTIRYADTAVGRNPTEVNYDDYRSEGGVKVPFQWTIARPLGRFTIQVSEVQQNVPIDDKKFEKPPAPPAAEQKPSGK